MFLREASRALPNVRVSAERAGEVRGDYDWAVSRAVAPVELLALNPAPRLALLVGDEDAGVLAGFDMTPLPWGDRRVLAVRQCST